MGVRGSDRGSTFGGWLLHSTFKGGRASLVLIHPLNLSRAGSKRHTSGPRLSRRAKPREGVMLINTASLGEEPPLCRLPAKANEFPSGTQQQRVQDQGEPPRWRTSAVVWHGEGWAPPCERLPKTHLMRMTTTTQSIPARSSLGTRTTPSVVGHQGGGEKCATDAPKPLRARNNITIGT